MDKYLFLFLAFLTDLEFYQTREKSKKKEETKNKKDSGPLETIQTWQQSLLKTN